MKFLASEPDRRTLPDGPKAFPKAQRPRDHLPKSAGSPAAALPPPPAAALAPPPPPAPPPKSPPSPPLAPAPVLALTDSALTAPLEPLAPRTMTVSPGWMPCTSVLTVFVIDDAGEV